jgi:hypothetical protein
LSGLSGIGRRHLGGGALLVLGTEAGGHAGEGGQQRQEQEQSGPAAHITLPGGQ